jgi:GT2 family glycosyltransferase
MERNPPYTMKKFGIGIPTLNRADLLIPAIKKYVNDFPEVDIHIIDNGKQEILNKLLIDKEIYESRRNIYLIENEKNIGVGASWNMLCYFIFSRCENALILNDDIYLGKSKSEIERLIDKKNNSFITATPDWCAFIISKKIYESVGKFDECFYPAYYEDNSYAYRMKLKGINHHKTPYLNPIEYRVSQTIEKDKSIFDYRTKNKELYIQMWGGLPERETFLTPFNK